MRDACEPSVPEMMQEHVRVAHSALGRAAHVVSERERE
eukprot:COSAG03_NODE_20972_length_311_cov_0.485849_1_plen_37_part_01